jgi:uncharacterized protein (UPF0548 family)
VPIRLGRVSDDELLRMALAARKAPYSYTDVGGTRGTFPTGYRVDRYDIEVGDVRRFARAVEGLRSWEAHRRAGARVVPAATEIVVGETLLVALELVAVTMVAPCRIVYVTDEPARWGFAYGTLQGHPEQGEESFHVVRTDGSVRFEVAAFSRPRHLLARAGGPVARQLQARVTRRYLAGLRAFVDEAG